MQGAVVSSDRNVKIRSYKFSLSLILALSKLPRAPAVNIICDQLLRSGTSIGANLIEATGASSKLDFKKFHEIALKSANESKYWLCLLRDSNLASKEVVEVLLKEVIEISNMIASGILKMKGKKNN